MTRKKITVPTRSTPLREHDGSYTLETNLYEYLPQFEIPFIGTETLGEAFEPEQKFENPDGTPIVFRRDYFGKLRGITPIPGPFADGCEIKEFNVNVNSAVF